MTKGSGSQGKAVQWDAEQWCAEYQGKPSERKRYTDFELMLLKKRCELEDK